MKTQFAAHPPADVLLALGAGKLDNATAEAVFLHVENCPECLKATGRIAGDSLLNKLRAEYGASGTVAPSQDLSTFPPAANAASISTTSQIPALSIPQELHDHPQYEVLRELGRGGMGVVYLAKNKLMDRKEVLKVVNKQLLGDAGATERFLREIRAAAQLNHPNIVTAYSALQAGELLLFSMEYIDGRDLAEVIKSRGPLPAAHSGSYVLQAARGLQHAFEKGMVHRDVKPQNLILDGKKNLVKILDFGLAKATRATETPAEGLTGLNMMMGTPDYMAPEQARDATNVDIRADIYSLGCTLYFLLAGRAPFVGGSLAAKIAAHQLSEPDPIESLRTDLPAGLAEIARKMMAKDPAARYQKPEEVVQALTACFKGQGKQPTANGASAKAVTVKPIAASQLSLMREDKSIFEKKTLAPVPAPRQTMRERPSPVLPIKNEKTARPRKKWPMAAAGAAAMLILVLIGLWAAGVFRVKTADGVLVVDVNEPNAEVFVDGERVKVSWDNGGKTAEVHVKPGTRKVEVRKDGFSVDGKELTFKDGDREVFAARLTPDEPRMVKVDAPPRDDPPQPTSTPEKAPPPSETPPLAKSPPLNSPTLGTVAPRLARSDYDDLAKGRWVAVLPSVKEFERLRSEKAYTGGEPKLVNGVLQLNGGNLLFPPIHAKDAIVRAWVSKPGPKFNGNVALILRRNSDGDVAAFFGGGGYFGIGRMTNHKWKDLQTCQFSEPYDGFFEFAFAAVGNRLIAYANGRKILETRDEAPLDSPADIGVGSHRQTDGFGLFRDIEVQVLDEPSAEKPDKPSADKPAEPSQRPAPGGLPPEAKEAAKAFEKSRDDAHDALLADFDTVVDRLEKMSGSTQQRLKMIDAVKEEKNRFENSGLIPWSEPMRPYLAKYLAATKTAEEKLVHVYTSLIDAQLKAKNESMAADLQTDLANLLNVRVVARWKEFMDGKPWGIRSLFSNGKIDNVKWKTTWSYSEGDLIQKWVDAKAPGGVWVAKLKLSADGKTYAGTNNNPLKQKFTGVYLKDE